MISGLIKRFNEIWEYKETVIEDYVVEDTGDIYRVIIKNTCEWYTISGGCSMCNYSSRGNVHATDIIRNQGDKILDDLILLKKEYRKIKFYINGSFFNEKELKRDILISFLNELRINLNINEISVETRPEYLDEEYLNLIIKKTNLTFEICFGIESTNDEIRNYCIHKGINLIDFFELSSKLKSIAKIKVYLLVKPPFLTEKQAIEDVVSSINELTLKGITCISYTPIAVQSNTLLEFLLQEKMYRPVWIWSLIEINTRLKMQDNDFTLIHLSGFDYYPQPIAEAFNCERCTSKLLSLLMKNKNITWDDIDEEITCDCINKWKKEVGIYDTVLNLQVNIKSAEDKLVHNIIRTEEILLHTNATEHKCYITDVAKEYPKINSVLDYVGIENIKLPIKIDGFSDSVAIWNCSTDLDEFHRGIHMSRLIEKLNLFSLSDHEDIINDIQSLLKEIISVNDSVNGSVVFICDLHKKIKTPLSNRTISTEISLKIDMSLCENEFNSNIMIRVPFINACPCTLITAYEIFGQTFSHTQKGTIEVSFINNHISFNEMIIFIEKYIAIFDLLKREDEIYVVKNAFENPQFCEDICRNVSSSLVNNFIGREGKAFIKVITEESIHPHSAFAQKMVYL